MTLFEAVAYIVHKGQILSFSPVCTIKKAIESFKVVVDVQKASLKHIGNRFML